MALLPVELAGDTTNCDCKGCSILFGKLKLKCGFLVRIVDFFLFFFAHDDVQPFIWSFFFNRIVESFAKRTQTTWRI